MQYILTIDVGSSSSKLALFDTQGTLVTLVRKSTNLSASDSSLALREYQPRAWWESCVEGIRELLAKTPIKASSITTIGLSGQIGTHILLDDKHQSLMSAISWQDGRSEEEAQWLDEAYPAKELDQLLGMHLPKGTAWPIPRLLWLKKHKKELFSQPFTMMQPKDYIALKLTGECKTDILSLRGLMNPKTKTIHTTIKKTILGIEDIEERLPKAEEATSILGTVSKEVSEQTGLPYGCTVVTGCGDFHASLIGTGIIDDTYAFNITGTSDHIGWLTSTKGHQAYDTRLGRYPSVVPGWDIWYGATSAGGGSFQWFLNTFGDKGESESIRNYVERNLKQASKPTSLIYLPYINGERAPIWNAKARGSFVGFASSHTKAEFLRSVLEGVAFSLKDCLDIMSKKEQAPLQLRVSGAAAGDDLWNQLKADILGMQVSNMRCHESSSLGAAVIAAVGKGLYASMEEATKQMVQTESQYEPTMTNTRYYEEMFAIYRNTYESLRGSYEQLAALRSSL